MNWMTHPTACTYHNIFYPLFNGRGTLEVNSVHVILSHGENNIYQGNSIVYPRDWNIVSGGRHNIGGMAQYAFKTGITL